MVKDQNGKLDDSGCLHCYAKALAERFPDTFGKWGKGAPRRKSKSAVKDALVFNRKQWICENGHANSSDTFCYEDGCESAIFHRRAFFHFRSATGSMTKSRLNGLLKCWTRSGSATK